MNTRLRAFAVRDFNWDDNVDLGVILAFEKPTTLDRLFDFGIEVDSIEDVRLTEVPLDTKYTIWYDDIFNNDTSKWDKLTCEKTVSKWIAHYHYKQEAWLCSHEW